jgi:hypothetical protein
MHFVPLTLDAAHLLLSPFTCREGRRGRENALIEEVFDWRRTGKRIAAIVRGLTTEPLAGEMAFPAGQLAHEIYEHTDLHIGYIRR